MKKKQQPSGPQKCQVCSASLKNPHNLAKHSLKTGHQASQCCSECVRWFCSEQSLAQHRDSKHGKLPAVNISSSIPLPSPEPCQLFADRNYTRSFRFDPNAAYDLLLAACQSHPCLRKEGYILPDDLSKKNGRVRKYSALWKQCLPTPAYDPFSPKRKAVALDCEMAGVGGRKSEVVSICVVDFFTGEILMNSLVKPRVPIVNWRSGVTGITPTIMSVAVATGQALDGWETAREELWKHVNTSTIVVGQSLHYDLKALRVVHSKVVDTLLLTTGAVFGMDQVFHRRWGLQSLCDELLHLQIRQRGFHNELEDTMATREVALWCLFHPVELQNWAGKARRAFESEAKKREDKKRSRTAARTRNCQSRYGGYIFEFDEYYDDEDEVLHWSDVVDWDTWPKSPPDSD